MNEFPTEIIELPSKGLVYPESNPLSSGKVEMKYMTAFHEDILTNQNYVKQNIVLDKLLQSLIVSKINYNDLIIGDKNALLVAARVLGYGKDYTFRYNNQEFTVDLSKLESKIVEDVITKGKNEFKFTLPKSGTELFFKLLTLGDEQKINQELEGLKKVNKNSNSEMSLRLKYMLTSVGGKTESKEIREFVDKYFLAMDARAFREYIKKIQPNIDLTFNYTNEEGLEENTDIPIGVDFFWPDAGI